VGTGVVLAGTLMELVPYSTNEAFCPQQYIAPLLFKAQVVTSPAVSRRPGTVMGSGSTGVFSQAAKTTSANAAPNARRVIGKRLQLVMNRGGEGRR
jgi:hypothetical protein